MKEGLVSIIMPFYNAENTIKESIRNIRCQSYLKWELLLIDDGSTDGSLEIVQKEILSDSRIKLFSQENKGAGAARNLGISKSEGVYIAFCDSDDLWHCEKLERQVIHMTKNSLAFTYSSYEKIDSNGRHLSIIRVPERITYQNLLYVNQIGCLTAIYDVRSLGKLYFTDLKMSEDYEKWLRIFSVINETKGLNEVLAYYRVSANSLSANKFEAMMFRWKVLGMREDLGTVKRLLCIFAYALNGLLKLRF